MLGELAAMRVPDLDALDSGPATAPTLEDVAKRWLKARVDVTDRTRVQLRVDVNRFLPVLGTRPVDEITPADVAELIGKPSAKGASERRSKNRSGRSRRFSTLPGWSATGTRPATGLLSGFPVRSAKR